MEKVFPEYGEFKTAENILHIINDQALVWMAIFFAPGLGLLNIFKLTVVFYMRAWAVSSCNIPPERVFKISKSNNFYFAMLLFMLFLCMVGW